MTARPILVSLVGTVLAGCADRAATLRTWEGCLVRQEPAPLVRACGRITLRGRLGDTTRFVRQVEHTIPLERLADADGELAREGYAERNGDAWRMELGTEQEGSPGTVTMMSDGGAFRLDLRARGDSLVGTWTRDCFLACPQHGTVTLRHVRTD
jgi:hypothetical protein